MPRKDFDPLRGMQIIEEGCGNPPKQYESGRKCSFPNCGTVLSRYNPGQTCSIHSRRVRY